MYTQRAGCNAGTAKADGQRAWWQLPRGIWRVLRVLRLKAGKRQAWMPQQQRALCRQRAGCNPGTAKADGHRAWWQLPRGIWRILRVLSVWSLANGRLECPNKRVLWVWSLANGRLECPNNRGLCAGKGQAATLEQQKLTARWLGGSCCEGFGGFNGRLECPNNRGLCAGKGQAATLEQQKLTARGLGGSCREGVGGF